MSEPKEVVILGAGAVGCSTAFHLAKRGIPSTVVERESIGARASGKAWAVIAYPPMMMVSENNTESHYSFPEGDGFSFFQDLFWKSWFRLEELAREVKEKSGIDIEYGDMPMTRLASTEAEEAAYKRLLARLEVANHHEARWIERDEIREIFPGIRPDVRGGLCVPQIQVEPYKYTLGLAQSAEAMGATIQQGEVTDFKVAGGRVTSVVLSSGREVPADALVIAMGPWSGQASAKLGYDLPLTNAMTECLRLRPKRKFPNHSVSGGVEVLARVSGDIIVAGAETDSEGADYFELKMRTDFNTELSDWVKTSNIRAATALLPELNEAEIVEHRGDILAYGKQPHHHKPVVGRLPGMDNAYLATRFGAIGIQMSLGAGEVMAELIADGEPSFRHKRMMNYLSPK